MMSDYPEFPGKGSLKISAIKQRHDYLQSLVPDIKLELGSQRIQPEQVRNNIENFVGTTEIPLGTVGPLLFKENDKSEWINTAVATSEGALVASMNRGAKAISESGGFEAQVIHQKMLRTPMFSFVSMHEALRFEAWIKAHFSEIKELAQSQSNHAELIEINRVVIGKIVHLKFAYTTSDAAGQNMTTACTWHACLWIEEQFQAESGIEIQYFVIDGNGASDKKVSYYAMQNGRGIHVVAECFLSNEVVERTLRCNAEDIFRSFNHSAAISRLDGMIGYNINVANTIASFFAATGQDLACIHESSIAVLQMELQPEGLYCSLSLPNLVIGTVGGGTQLPAASQVLSLMDCKGYGKVNRLAKIIAGFALSLEMSTLAAIVSGQFVRAHQSLGRNRPVDWLRRGELDAAFFKEHCDFESLAERLEFVADACPDNGILTELSQKASKKLVGLVSLDLHFEKGDRVELLLKSKALGKELSNGLHYMAANVSAKLADALREYLPFLEYADSHQRELVAYRALAEIDFQKTPKLHGIYEDAQREVFLLMMERLRAEDMERFNFDDSNQVWTSAQIKLAIEGISEVHKAYYQKAPEQLPAFNFESALNLFHTFIEVNRGDYRYLDIDQRFIDMQNTLSRLLSDGLNFKIGETLIHHDYNPRNVGIRNSGELCIYDWELAVSGVPQRDIFEFLAFTISENLAEKKLDKLLRYHFDICKSYAKGYDWKDYLADFNLAGNQFILSRLNFYMAGNTLVKYPFLEKVLRNAFTLIDLSRG